MGVGSGIPNVSGKECKIVSEDKNLEGTTSITMKDLIELSPDTQNCTVRMTLIPEILTKIQTQRRYEVRPIGAHKRLRVEFEVKGLIIRQELKKRDHIQLQNSTRCPLNLELTIRRGYTELFEHLTCFLNIDGEEVEVKRWVRPEHICFTVQDMKEELVFKRFGTGEKAAFERENGIARTPMKNLSTEIQNCTVRMTLTPDILTKIRTARR